MKNYCKKEIIFFMKKLILKYQKRFSYKSINTLSFSGRDSSSLLTRRDIGETAGFFDSSVIFSILRKLFF